MKLIYFPASLRHAMDLQVLLLLPSRGLGASVPAGGEETGDPQEGMGAPGHFPVSALRP